VAASKESLEALHTAIAKKLIESIDTIPPGEKGLAALLNVARQFVKDNGIEALPAEGSPLSRLSKRLEDFPFDPAEAIN
jgi:hypothetical protein